MRPSASTRAPLPAGIYLGTPLRAVSAPGRFLVRESAYVAAQRLPRHSHTCVHFCLVLTGEYEEEIEGRAVRRGAGDLMLYPAGAGHAEAHSRAGRHLIIELREALVARAREQCFSLDASRTWTRGGERTHFFHRLRRELARCDDLSPLAVEGCLLELVAALARAERGTDRMRAQPSWLPAVEEILRARLAAPPSLDELHLAIGVHPAALARAFRRAHGCSLGTFVRCLRIARASELLRGTALPIAAVAFEAGFYDQSHLGRVFRRETGMTPRQYRRSG